MKRVALITAGGSGERMGGSVSKQYLEIDNMPILSHTLLCFNIKVIDAIVLVLPKDDIPFFKEKVPKELNKQLFFTEGGDSRQSSVYNGILKVREVFKEDADNITLIIHDGVRPFVLKEEIIELVKKAEKYGGAILASPIFETVKKASISSFIEKTIDREDMYVAKTPQTFKFSLIENAYKVAKKNNIKATDDASLCENKDCKVKLILSNPFNIKITVKKDLDLVKFYINEFKKLAVKN